MHCLQWKQGYQPELCRLAADEALAEDFQSDEGSVSVARPELLPPNPVQHPLLQVSPQNKPGRAAARNNSEAEVKMKMSSRRELAEPQQGGQARIPFAAAMKHRLPLDRSEQFSGSRLISAANGACGGNLPVFWPPLPKPRKIQQIRCRSSVKPCQVQQVCPIFQQEPEDPVPAAQA